MRRLRAVYVNSSDARDRVHVISVAPTPTLRDLCACAFVCGGHDCSQMLSPVQTKDREIEKSTIDQ
jgi:hypothetical protein